MGTWMWRLALGASALGALLVAAAGPGYRLSAWSLSTAFALLLWGAGVGAGGAVLGLAGLALNRPRVAARGFILSGAALVLGVLAVGIPWQWQRAAQRVPRIHDISTDTITPPGFDAVVPLRADAPNSLDYLDEVAAEQRRGYPDLGPLVAPVEPDAMYALALAEVERRGWTLVSADAERRVIEATDTTLWFGFTDDVVIRVTRMPAGSRVDVRSVSRVGRSDLGTNARRIREFLQALAARS